MEKIKIADACELLNGYAFKSEKYVESGIRIIRIANVQKGFIEDNSPVFYPMDLQELDKFMLKSGDLLVSLTGNVGRVAILEKNMLPAALNQRVACLRLKTNKITRGFLFYILNSDFFEQQCIQSSKGVAQKNMSTEWLKEYEIPLYSLEEQRKITEILDEIRRIIVLRNKELEKLDNLIKARFVEMFGAGYIKDTDWVYFTEEGHQKNAKSILKENDLIIVRSGTPGTACVVTKEYAGCNAIDIIIAHPNCKKVNPFYLCAFTNMPHGKKQIDEGIGGAAQQHFNVGKYNKVRLMLPPMELQKEFEIFVHQVDKSKLKKLR